MSFVDYSNNRVIIPWTLQSADIPTDVPGIIGICNEEGIPVFLEINYSDYVPGPAGTGLDSLQETDTTTNLISFLYALQDQGLYIDGVTYGDELEDPAGYGDIKPTIHNSDFIGRYLAFAQALKSAFPDLKIYAFDSSINAAQGRVSKYWAFFQRIRQAEIAGGQTLIDGFVFRESYVYIDENGNPLDPQYILDDTESLYRDTPVYRYDVPGTTFPNPDRDYLHTLIEETTEIFDRSIDIGLTEYLPAGPIQISETDTSEYADIDFIIHYSDIIGIYAELGLDFVSRIMFGDSLDMHKSYFDRDGNLGTNYPIQVQLAKHFSGEILNVDRSVSYEELRVKVYATRQDNEHFVMVLNKDVDEEATILLTLPDQMELALRLPARSYTSFIIDPEQIVVSGISG